MALGLPVSLTTEHRAHVSALIKQFYLYLPCIHCRYHYFQVTKGKVYEFKNKNEVLSTIMDIHNQVRRRLQKPPIRPGDVVSYFYDEQSSLTHYVFALSLMLCAYFVFRYNT